MEVGDEKVGSVVHPPKTKVSNKWGLTLTEILLATLGKWATRNESPGRGRVTLNTPVVRFGRSHVSVTAEEPGTMVSRGKCV